MSLVKERKAFIEFEVTLDYSRSSATAYYGSTIVVACSSMVSKLCALEIKFKMFAPKQAVRVGSAPKKSNNIIIRTSGRS